MNFDMYRSVDDNSTRISIVLKEMVALVSQHAMLEMTQREIVRQLQDNEDLRILVREMVSNAISKMNLQEVVGLAVREHLKVPTQQTDGGQGPEPERTTVTTENETIEPKV